VDRPVPETARKAIFWFGRLTEMAMVADCEPAAAGAKTTWNAALCPAAKGMGNAGPVTMNWPLLLATLCSVRFWLQLFVTVKP